MKIYKKIGILFIVTSVLFLASCFLDSTDNFVNNNQGNQSVICPLVVGYSWTFLDSIFGENGGITLDTSLVSITKKADITIDEKVHSVFYWNWFNFEADNWYDLKWLISGNNQGVWHVGALCQSDTILSPSLRLKYPATAFEKWDYNNFYYNTGLNCLELKNESMVCESVDHVVTTPIGDFTCYIYHYQFNSSRGEMGSIFNNQTGLTQSQKGVHDIYLFYAPNVGFVAYEEKINGALFRKKVLLKRNIN